MPGRGKCPVRWMGVVGGLGCRVPHYYTDVSGTRRPHTPPAAICIETGGVALFSGRDDVQTFAPGRCPPPLPHG